MNRAGRSWTRLDRAGWIRQAPLSDLCFSPKYGSGQQCCYTAEGTQLLTADSTSGSTPDRGHDWGAPPYRAPPRVPGLSHWLYDVISFYYCCLWAPECPRYMRRRRSSDCRAYQPPRIGGHPPGWARDRAQSPEPSAHLTLGLPQPPLSGIPTSSPLTVPTSPSTGTGSMCWWRHS